MPHTAQTLGTRLNIKVVLVRTFQMRTILVRNISYGNTTGTSSGDQTTWCIAIISKPCKWSLPSFSCVLSVLGACMCCYGRAHMLCGIKVNFHWVHAF